MLLALPLAHTYTARAQHLIAILESHELTQVPACCSCPPGKSRLVWPGSKDAALSYQPKVDEMVLTAHRFFANKACPGDYMYTRFGQMAEEVTARLEDDDDMTQEQFNQMMAAYEASKANPVPDNDPADWEKEGVEWAVQNGLMAGDGTGNLKLHDNITRGQFCVMLKRYHDQMKG